MVGRQLGQRRDRCLFADLGEKIGNERIQVPKIGGLGAIDSFKLGDHQAVPDVAHHIEMAVVAKRDGAQIHRTLTKLVGGQFARHALATGLADDGCQWQADRRFRRQTGQR